MGSDMAGVVGPEGWKLLWILAILAVFLLLMSLGKRKKGIKTATKKPFFRLGRIELKLTKDKQENPQELTMKLINRGNTDMDIANPILTFYNFWTYKKFKLRGSDGYEFYPLVLEKGETHTLHINLKKFYVFNERLSRFSKAKIRIYSISGSLLAKKSLYLKPSIYPF